MHVIIGTDADSQANAYLHAMTGGLAAGWRQLGYRVSETGRRPDASQSERLLEDPDASVLLVSTGPVARRLARSCRELGRPYLSTSLAVTPSSGFDTALAEIHAGAERVLVPVPAARDLLATRGVVRTALINGAVDDQAFQPRVYNMLDLPRPLTLLLSTGDDTSALRHFLELPLPGSRLAYVPGWTGISEQDGVAIFSYRGPAEQASLISAADVCVVAEGGPAALLLCARSLACGVPVASLPGPYVNALLDSAAVGAADQDLGRAVAGALTANRQLCRRVGSNWSWRRAARQVLATLAGPRAAIAA